MKNNRIKEIKREIAYYKMLTQDKRTPKVARWFLACAVGYLLMPFDIIPDFIPVLGQLDDLLIVPLLVYIGIKLIPLELRKELRDKAALDNI